jgi:predicted DsbA family dithiol-disulfide isomerase
MKSPILAGLIALATFGCASATDKNSSNASAAPVPASQSAKGESDLQDPVAIVNGEPISLAEFEKETAGSVIAAEIAVFEAREQGLQKMISDRLLEGAAKKEGIEVDEFLKREIEGKTTPPTDQEIEAFYNSRRAQMPQPLEQMRPQLMDYLVNEKRREAFMGMMEELSTAAGVETFLPVYRVSVDATKGYRKGSPDAPIQIVEFSDFECPYCIRAASTVEEVLAHYGDKVSVVYRHFPLSFHQNAHLAAQASECAGAQGKFWEYHDLLFANQKSMGKADLLSYGTQLKLDTAVFDACVNNGEHAAKVDEDMAEGAKIGMNGTPGFYINGIVLTGAVPFENFKVVIDEELERLKP